jgi:glutamine amidotransferase
MKVALLDYGVGNLHSLAKAVEALGAKAEIVADWERIAADALILPGVGSFGSAAKVLEARRQELCSLLQAGYPCLGICLGMQLLFQESEEAPGSGLGLVPGKVERLQGAVVPHMGWSSVASSADPLFFGVDPLVAYFAHSFICRPEDEACVIAWTEYSGQRFPAAVRLRNTWGVQFHPEKSSTQGLQLLRNFLQVARSAE